MTIFGYARASISQPSLDPQIDILSRHGVRAAHLFTDAPAGRRAERAGLQGLQGAVRSGDTVLVTRLDRLGRDLNELIELIRAFDAAGVGLRFLEDDITTENGLARVVLAVLVAEAQAERRRLQERTSEGRVEAREKGVRFGRKPSVDRDMVQELRRQGLGATDIARQMRIGRSTVYAILHSGLRGEPEDAP